MFIIYLLYIYYILIIYLSYIYHIFIYYICIIYLLCIYYIFIICLLYIFLYVYYISIFYTYLEMRVPILPRDYIGLDPNNQWSPQCHRFSGIGKNCNFVWVTHIVMSAVWLYWGCRILRSTLPLKMSMLCVRQWPE